MVSKFKSNTANTRNIPVLVPCIIYHYIAMIVPFVSSGENFCDLMFASFGDEILSEYGLDLIEKSCRPFHPPLAMDALHF